MKYSILFLFVFLPSLLFGQSKTPSFYHPNYNPTYAQGVPAHLIQGQMLNILNTYGYVGQLVTAFSDTFTQATGTINLTPLDGGNNSTWALWPLYQNGTLAVVLNCTKISGTPDIVATLRESPDGITYGPATINYAPTSASSLTSTVTTTYTPTTPEKFTMTNTAGVQSMTWNVPIKYTPYPAVAITTTTVTQSSTCKVKYVLNF